MENQCRNNACPDHLSLLDLFMLAERIHRPTTGIDDLCEKVTFIVGMLNKDPTANKPVEGSIKSISIPNPLSLEVTQQKSDERERLLKEREAMVDKRDSDIEARERAVAAKEAALAKREEELKAREGFHNAAFSAEENSNLLESSTSSHGISTNHEESTDSDAGSDVATPPASETDEEDDACLFGSPAACLSTSNQSGTVNTAYEVFGSDDELGGIATPLGSERGDN